MSRKPNKAKVGKSTQLTIVLPGEIIQKLDEEVAKLQVKMPGMTVTRSEIARQAIYSFLQQAGLATLKSDPWEKK